MAKFTSYLLKKAVGLYINLLSFINPKKATRLAYRFFSEPREGRLSMEQLPEVLKDAGAEMITHNEWVFQVYTWEGNENKVLLVHGWESNTSRWEELIKYLKASGSTIIAIDAPAHGLSSGTEFNIPRYAEFIDIIVRRHRPQVLVGHSLGGATAIYYQAHYPNDAIRKMVILGAPSDLDTILANYRTMLSLNSKVFHLLKKYFIKNFRIRTKEFSGSRFASKLNVKGFLAHDKDDEIVAFKEGEKIARAWAGAEFVITQGLGHSMHDEALYRKIYRFIFDEEFTPPATAAPHSYSRNAGTV